MRNLLAFLLLVFPTLLLESANLNLYQQALKLEQAFDNWKSDFEQVDDITVLGLRFI